MKYERIDKVQSGISPVKLRMKQVEPHHRKKDGDFDMEVPSLDVAPVKVSDGAMLDSGLNGQVCSQTMESLPRENIDAGHAKLLQFSKTDNGNSSAIHPAKVEQMRAQAEAKMVKKIAMAKQRSEEKRAAAEARKHRDAERTSAQVQYIRRTGRIPSSRYICFGWLS